MSQLDNIVNITITRGSRSISRAGFGIPFIFGIHTQFAEEIKEYTSIASVAEDFDTTDLEYKKAKAIFDQTPSPEKIKIGKRVANVKQDNNVSVDSIAAGTYTVTINGTDFSYVASGSESAADIVDALVIAINLGSEPVTLTDNGDDFDIEADVAGVGFTLAVTSPSTNMTITETLDNVSLLTELLRIAQVDNDWYFLLITSTTEQDILDGASYVLSVKKLFAVLGSDANIITSSTTDIASKLKALNNPNVFVLYTSDADSHKEAAWVGKCAPETPGTITWKFKNLFGIIVDSLTDAQIAYATGKNCNLYVNIGGLDITVEGNMSNSETNFIDQQRGEHWLVARITEAVFAVLVNNKKVPFTNAGIDSVSAEILKVLRIGIANGLLSGDVSPTVTAPDVSTISAANKTSRILPDIEFTGTLAGAIHAAKTIKGLVQV